MISWQRLVKLMLSDVAMVTQVIIQQVYGSQGPLSMLHHLTSKAFDWDGFFYQFYDKHVEQKSVDGVKMNWCIWIYCKLFNFAQIVLCCISITNKTILISVGNLTVSFFKTNINPSPYIVGIFGSFKGSCQRSQGLKGKISLLKNTDANRDKRLKKNTLKSF